MTLALTQQQKVKTMTQTRSNSKLTAAHHQMTFVSPRVRQIAAQELVTELNHVVDRHNAMTADFLHCLLWLSRQWAISRRKAAQFDALLDENNRLLELAQRAAMLQDENDHLWRVVADLDAELKELGNICAGE